MKSYNLFAYGTLRQGFHNHALLEGAKYCGKGLTCEKMAMKVMGNIPFVEPNPNGKQVVGELYEVTENTLLRIHRMELNCGYKATWHTVEVNGQKHRAIVYTFNLSSLRHGQDIPSCDYADHMVRPVRRT